MEITSFDGMMEEIDRLVGVTTTKHILPRPARHTLLNHLQQSREFLPFSGDVPGHTRIYQDIPGHLSPLPYRLYNPSLSEELSPPSYRLCEEDDSVVSSVVETISEVMGVSYNSVSVLRLTANTEGNTEDHVLEECSRRDPSFPVFIFSLNGPITLKFTGCHRSRRQQKLIPDREVFKNCGVSIQDCVLRQYDFSLVWRKTSCSQYVLVCRVDVERVEAMDMSDVLLQRCGVETPPGSSIGSEGYFSSLYHRNYNEADTSPGEDEGEEEGEQDVPMFSYPDSVYSDWDLSNNSDISIFCPR
ncbi:uncharacterized protein LOC134820035 [Bolinopsis microptera]|uniref:uncharacterized protein LOC134820035 n=1 Tax=Bolinopsis microptera TaxID=2820187 RepID=UPI00307AFF4E